MNGLAAAHTLALLKKQYPYGVAKKHFTGKKVVFFVLAPLTVEEQELIISAAVKGLKLLPDQFAVEIGERKIPAVHLVICGDATGIDTASVPGRFVYQTHAPARILADAGLKKQFWETIKPIMTL